MSVLYVYLLWINLLRGLSLDCLSLPGLLSYRGGAGARRNIKLDLIYMPDRNCWACFITDYYRSQRCPIPSSKSIFNINLSFLDEVLLNFLLITYAFRLPVVLPFHSHKYSRTHITRSNILRTCKAGWINSLPP